MRRRRLLAGAICGVATLIVSTPSAFASIWEPTDDGVAEICIVARTFNSADIAQLRQAGYRNLTATALNKPLPAVAKQQLDEVAAAWNKASTKLDVKTKNCSDGAHVVPVGVAKLNGPIGSTAWLGAETKTSAFTLVDEPQIDNLRGSEDDVWEGVLCHEIGHALGLWNNQKDIHTKEAGSCMQSHVSKLPPKPTANDLADLREMYGGKAKAKAPAVNTARPKASTGEPDASTSETGPGTVNGARKSAAVGGSARQAKIIPAETGATVFDGKPATARLHDPFTAEDEARANGFKNQLQSSSSQPTKPRVFSFF